jgi:hypothetical protein
MPLQLKAKVARTATGLSHVNHLRVAGFGVIDLHLENDNASSASKCHLPDGYTAAAAGKDDFVFVPEHETIKLCYELDNASGYIAKAKLDLFSRFRKNPLWTLDLAKCGPDWLAHGKHVVSWDGRTPDSPTKAEPGTETATGFEHSIVGWKPHPKKGVFPDGFVTLEHSPYKLKLTVAREGQRGEPSVAWTYFHLLVKEVLVELGGEALIPKSGKTAAILEQEKMIRARLQAAGGLPSAATRQIRLVSNLFKRSGNEMNDNTAYDQYLGLWGKGPSIPIIAKIHLQDSKGATVKIEDGPGAKALGLTPVLWDWEDIAENVAAKQPEAAPRTFITQAIDYYKDNTDAHNTQKGKVVTPVGDNCHVDRGGKRGLKAQPTFPAQAGYAPKATLTDGAFPFEVEACTGRAWAAFSRGWTDGELKGRTGCLFLPSRMAGDTYKVRACVAVEKTFEQDASAKKKVEAITADTVDALPLKADAKLVKDVATFEIWRELHITRYVRKQATIADFLATNLVAVQTPYAEAYVQLEDRRGPTDTYVWSDHRTAGGTVPDYDKACRDAIAALHDPVLNRAVAPAANHAGAKSEFEVRTFAQFDAAVLAGTGGNVAQANAFKISHGVTNQTDYVNYLTGNLPGDVVLNHMQLLQGHRNGDADPAKDGITVMHFDHLHSQMGAAIVAGLAISVLNGMAADPPDATRHRCAFIFWNARVDTFVHEIGHHLFLPHSPFPVASPPGGAQRERHDELDAHCLMTYNRPRKSFCGLCQLRLRGWNPGPNNAAKALLQKTGASNKKP